MDDNPYHLPKHRRAAAERGAVERHPDTFLDDILHLAHPVALALGHPSAWGRVGHETEPTRKAPVRQAHELGRQMLSVGDHLHRQAVRGERCLEQPRLSPGTLSHGARLAAEHVDDVLEPGTLARLQVVGSGCTVACRGDDATADQPAGEVDSARQFGREAHHRDRGRQVEQPTDRAVARRAQVSRVLRTTLGGREVGTLEMRARNARQALLLSHLVERGNRSLQVGERSGDQRRQDGRDAASPQRRQSGASRFDGTFVEARAASAVRVDIHEARCQVAGIEVADDRVRGNLPARYDALQPAVAHQDDVSVQHLMLEHHAGTDKGLETASRLHSCRASDAVARAPFRRKSISPAFGTTRIPSSSRPSKSAMSMVAGSR